MSNDNLRDFIWLQPGPLQDIFDHSWTKVTQRHRGQSAIQATCVKMMQLLYILSCKISVCSFSIIGKLEVTLAYLNVVRDYMYFEMVAVFTLAQIRFSPRLQYDMLPHNVVN